MCMGGGEVFCNILISSLVLGLIYPQGGQEGLSMNAKSESVEY